MFAKFFSSEKDASGKRYAGYYFSSKKSRRDDDNDDDNDNTINDNNTISNNDNTIDDNTIDDDDDDNDTRTCIKENNYVLNIGKIDSKGTYSIKYNGDDQTQVVLKNTTVHKFHDGSMRRIIDIDHIYKATVISTNLFSQNTTTTTTTDDNDSNDGSTKSKTLISLEKIAEKGDVLLMINKIMVYDKKMDDVTTLLSSLTEQGKTKELVFLKQSKVSLDHFLNDYYHVKDPLNAPKGELLSLNISNIYADNLNDIGTMLDQQDPALILKVGDLYTFTTSRVQDGGTHCPFPDKFMNIEISSIDVNRGLTLDFEVHNFDRLNKSKGLIGTGGVRIIDVIRERMFKCDFTVHLQPKGEIHMSGIMSKVIEKDNDDDDSTVTGSMVSNITEAMVGNVKSSKSMQQYTLKKYKNVQVNNDDFADISAEDQQVVKEQYAAQIAALACEIPARAIRDGIRKTVLSLRKKPKTLYDFNHERKRDIHINPKAKYEKPNPLDISTEVHGKTGYADLDTYPNSYIRDYQMNAFTDSMKLVHPRLKIFNNILRIDMSGQLIGDDKLEELCKMIPKCPLEILSLNECDITDAGMEILSNVLRSLSNLKQLNLSANLFTDEGIKHIFQEDKFSPCLEAIHLSRNGITLRSAYYIGQMFAPEINCKLDSLYLGGKLGGKSYGNEFLRVLVGALCKPHARPIRLLHYPDAGLTDEGIASICALITCSSDLKILNISKNPIVSNVSKSHLLEALRLNISIELLLMRQCGLSKHEMKLLQDAVASRSPLTWHEKTLVGLLTARELEECTRVSYNIEVTLVNVYLKKPPPPWPTKRLGKGEFSECLDFENISNFTRYLPKTIVEILRNCTFLAPYVDALVEFLEKGNEWLASSSKRLKDKAIIAEQDKDIDDSIKRYTKRRGTLISSRTSLRQIFDSFIASINASSPKGKVDTRKSIIPVSPVNKNRKTKNISSDQMCMGAEDYNSSMIELSVAYEEHIGLLHKIKLLRDEEDLDLLIPYYELELAACYTHFIYLALPAEEARKEYEAIMNARKAEAKRQEDLREQKKHEKEHIKSMKKSLKKGTTGGRKIRPKTDDDVKILEARAVMLAELKATADFLVLEQSMKKQLQHDAQLARKKKEDDLKRKEEEEASDEEKDWDDEPTDIIREPTQLLVWKKEIINRFKSLIITRADQERAVVMNSRAYRSKVVRRVPAMNLTDILQSKNIQLYFEDEDERSEAFGNLAEINTTRHLVNLQDRLYHRRMLQQQKWAELCH